MVLLALYNLSTRGQWLQTIATSCVAMVEILYTSVSQPFLIHCTYLIKLLSWTSIIYGYLSALSDTVEERKHIFHSMWDRALKKKKIPSCYLNICSFCLYSCLFYSMCLFCFVYSSMEVFQNNPYIYCFTFAHLEYSRCILDSRWASDHCSSAKAKLWIRAWTTRWHGLRPNNSQWIYLTTSCFFFLGLYQKHWFLRDALLPPNAYMVQRWRTENQTLGEKE